MNFRLPVVKALREQGYELLAAAPPDAHSEALAAQVDRYIPLPMQNSGTSPVADYALLQRYRECFKHYRPDAICAYTIKPNVYGCMAAGGLGIPIINNVSGLGTAFIRQNWLTLVVKQLYRYAFRRSSRVFFQNPADRELFIAMQLVEEAKTGLLPGSGINLQHFHPVDTAPDDAKADSFILIARMLWDKGVGEFIEAARIVRQSFPAAQFSLLGPTDVDNRTAIPREQIDVWQEEGIADYLGEAGDIRPYLAAHSCVVLPSYREGMSRVLLEAAAMGRPLIATNVPGCRDVVEHGRNGLLCELKNAEDLARQMSAFLRLSDKDRQTMAEQSRKKAEREFDEKRVVDRYLKEIRRLLKG